MKIILLKDVNDNEHKITPNSINKITQFGNHLIVETIYGNIITEGEKLILENSIHNCYLP
jgi:hypothetical protein